MKYLFELKSQKYNKWSIIVQITLFFFALVIISRLFWLQIVQGYDLKLKASENRQSENFRFRGEIVDRNGLRLAGDITLYDIYAHPQYYEKKTSIDLIASILSTALHKPKNELKEKLSLLNNSTISIAKNVNMVTVEKIIKPQIAKNQIRGLDFVKKANAFIHREISLLTYWAI